MEYPVYWLLKSSCFELSGDGNTVFFELKSWWKDDIYWLLESSCFELLGGGKYGLFLSQKVDGKIIFTDYWKVLVLNFSEVGNTVFFWVKKLMERWYLLGLLELSMIYQGLGNTAFRAVCEYLSVQCIWLYVIIMPRTHFRVNLSSIVTWMSRNSLLVTDTIPEV